MKYEPEQRATLIATNNGVNSTGKGSLEVFFCYKLKILLVKENINEVNIYIVIPVNIFVFIVHSHTAAFNNLKDGCILLHVVYYYICILLDILYIC